MFKNLNAEEARHDMNNISMGKLLGIDPVTYARKKATGKFTIPEAKKLTDYFDVTFDYLFETAADRGEENESTCSM